MHKSNFGRGRTSGWLLIGSVTVVLGACSGDGDGNDQVAEGAPETDSTVEEPEMAAEPEAAGPTPTEPEMAEPDTAAPTPATEPEMAEPEMTEPTPAVPTPQATGSCDPFDPCGGDVVATWQITAVCVDPIAIAGELSEELPPECADGIQSIVTSPMNMVVTYEEDGTTSASGALSFEMSLFYSAACLLALNPDAEATQAFCDQVGAQAAGDCTFVDGGCLCDVTQTSEIDSVDDYTIENGQLIDSDGAQDYCVVGDTMQVSPADGGSTIGSYTAQRLP